MILITSLTYYDTIYQPNTYYPVSAALPFIGELPQKLGNTN